MTAADWRNLDDATLAEYYAWLSDAARERAMHGRQEYGARFVGDPLAQATEEALDILFYLWQERRRRDGIWQQGYEAGARDATDDVLMHQRV